MPKQFKCRESAKKMIIAATGKRLRETGFDGIGVDALMREAGLTSGAFYTQFESKKDLLFEVLGDGLGQLKERIGEWKKNYGDDWLEKGFKEYFSKGHRACSSSGCVLPSLAIEVARNAGGCTAKQMFEEGLSEIVEEMAAGACDGGKADARQRAWTALALMTGGLILARAVADDETANEILAACQETVSDCQATSGRSDFDLSGSNF